MKIMIYRNYDGDWILAFRLLRWARFCYLFRPWIGV